MTSFYDVADELRRRHEELLRPFREQQAQLDQILRPYLEAQAHAESLVDQLRQATIGMNIAHLPQLHSQELVDALALTGTRDLTAIEQLIRPADALRDALSAHSDWITDAFGLTLADPLAKEELARSARALVLLSRAQHDLLGGTRWSAPRPTGESLTDVLLAGRSQWALYETSHPAGTPAARNLVLTASEQAVQRIADSAPDDPISFSTRNARREAGAAARILHLHVHLYAGPPGMAPVPRSDLLSQSQDLFRTIASVIRIVETRHGKPLAAGYAGWLLECAMDTIESRRLPSDRFVALAQFLFDFFVGAIDKAGAAIKVERPTFFSEVIRDLRNTHASHHPEAKMTPARVPENLAKRDQRLREVYGHVPVTQEEWHEATLQLLRMAASAAIAYRDRLDQP